VLSVAGFPPERKTLDNELCTIVGLHWQAAMEEELRSLQELHTRAAVQLPQNRRAIPGTWIFKRKLNSVGTLERLKARLVVEVFQ
jgi:hypothetical protein